MEEKIFFGLIRKRISKELGENIIVRVDPKEKSIGSNSKNIYWYLEYQLRKNFSRTIQKCFDFAYRNFCFSRKLFRIFFY